MDEVTLARKAATLGVRLSDTAAWELIFHLQAVLTANERINLTSVTDMDEAVAVHILDSLSAVPFIEQAPSGAVADIGSGAGYPGIPVAIVSDRAVTLIESRTKRATFLSTVTTALDHDISVVPSRAEEVAAVRRGEFAAVVARAVAPLPSLVELAAPLLADGGLFVALKGAPDDAELAQGDAAASRVGMSPGAAETVAVPDLDASRTIVTYRRVGDSEVDLPRRSGAAQKRPLI